MEIKNLKNIIIIILGILSLGLIIYGFSTAGAVKKQYELSKINNQILEIDNQILAEQVAYNNCTNEIMPNAHKKADELRAKKEELSKALLDFIQE